MTGKSIKSSAVKGQRRQVGGSGVLITRDSATGRFVGTTMIARKVRSRVVRSVDPLPPEPPLSERARAGMRRMAFVKQLRWNLNMSQEEFAAAYRIGLDTLKALERRTREPTDVEAAYFLAIHHEPEAIRLALAADVPV